MAVLGAAARSGTVRAAAPCRRSRRTSRRPRTAAAPQRRSRAMAAWQAFAVLVRRWPGSCSAARCEDQKPPVAIWTSSSRCSASQRDPVVPAGGHRGLRDRAAHAAARAPSARAPVPCAQGFARLNGLPIARRVVTTQASRRRRCGCNRSRRIHQGSCSFTASRTGSCPQPSRGRPTRRSRAASPRSASTASPPRCSPSRSGDLREQGILGLERRRARRGLLHREALLVTRRRDLGPGSLERDLALLRSGDLRDGLKEAVVYQAGRGSAVGSRRRRAYRGVALRPGGSVGRQDAHDLLAHR